MDERKKKQPSSFALEALGDQEREALLHPDTASEQARQELASMEETSGLLGLSAEPVAPPARLKASIMDAVRQTEQLSPLTDPTAGHSAPRSPEANARPRRTQRLFALAASVLLIAAMALGSLTVTMHSKQREMESQMASMKTHQETMARILSAPDAQSKTQTLSDGARITLSYSSSEGLMAVSTTGMPSLPEDQAYELWLMSDDGMVSAGMVDGADANGMMLVSDPMDGTTHFGITVEPATGSPKPTTDPIMMQSL